MTIMMIREVQQVNITCQSSRPGNPLLSSRRWHTPEIIPARHADAEDMADSARTDKQTWDRHRNKEAMKQRQAVLYS